MSQNTKTEGECDRGLLDTSPAESPPGQGGPCVTGSAAPQSSASGEHDPAPQLGKGQMPCLVLLAPTSPVLVLSTAAFQRRGCEVRREHGSLPWFMSPRHVLRAEASRGRTSLGHGKGRGVSCWNSARNHLTVRRERVSATVL